MQNLLSLINNRQPNSWRLFIFIAVFTLTLIKPDPAAAHQTPNTLVFVDVNTKTVDLELQIPLTELELAFGNHITKDPEHLIRQFGPQLNEYLRSHIHAYSVRSVPWLVKISNLRMDKGTYAENNLDYWELVASVALTPNSGESTRKFFLDYDVVMHQVMNHVALVSVRSDWEAGRIDPNITSQAIAISRNMKDNLIHPLLINLEEGSWTKGFKTMVTLGVDHIKEGTDHLLFLLTLLLPAALVASDGHWAKVGSVRYSLTRILKIVTAFTLGHSVTLLIGAIGLIHFSSRPIEILIALSILVSAVHAFKPIFPGKEIYIAAGFGLIHGMAFAQTLSNLHLDPGHMVLSILGFNIGIELMQLFVIVITMPWLLILSRGTAYTYVRIAGAVIAGIAAITWIVERVTNSPNVVSVFISDAATKAPWLILLLAVSALISLAFKKQFTVKKTN